MGVEERGTEAVEAGRGGEGGVYLSIYLGTTVSE